MESGAGPREVDLLINANRPEEAVQLLDRLESMTPKGGRARFVELYFRSAVMMQAVGMPAPLCVAP